MIRWIDGNTDDVIKGICLLIVQVILYGGVVVIAKKLISVDVSIFVILLFRYLLCLPLLLLFGFYQHRGNMMQVTDYRTLALRIIAGILALYTGFSALAYIDLSLVTALSQTMPIFITMLAPIMIAEVVGRHRMAAVAIGFIGVMVLVVPQLDVKGSLIGISLGLLSPLFAAIRCIFLRRLGEKNAPVTLAIWYNTVAALVMIAVVMFRGDDVLSFSEFWMILLLLGVITSFQQLFLAASHSYAPASSLAPVHFLTVPVGVIFGMVFFGEWPQVIFYVGAALVLAASFYIIYRERHLAVHPPIYKDNHG